MTFRKATRDDAATISRFVSKLATQHIAPALTSNGVATLLATMDVDSTRQRISDGWLHLMGFEESRLLGVAVVKPPTHLYHLFVETDFQRSGIGRNLFYLANELTDYEAGKPIQTVNSSLNAVEVYRRLGFVTEGKVVDQDGVRYQPMVRGT